MRRDARLLTFLIVLGLGVLVILTGPVCPPARTFGAFGPMSTDTGGVERFPLVELPARRAGGHTLALVLSGDGNWAPMISGLARTLADQGISVVGVRSATYLCRGRGPDEVAADLERVLRTYLARWGRQRIVVVGYSRGADMAPFLASRLPPDLRARLRLVALLSPAEKAALEFHWIDLLRSVSRPHDIPLLPEVRRLAGTPVLCVYGRTEEGALCPVAPRGLMKVVARPGGHATTNHALLASLILSALREAPAPAVHALMR
jgi:type IV secretory pathway VirJ component